MEPVTIAAMTPNDIPDLAELEKLCFTTPWSEQSLAAELEKPNAVFLTARLADGGLCGYVGMNYVLDEGYIDNLAVHPDCRRRGIGERLLKNLLQRCAELSLAFATLEVRAGNSAAISLYGGLGFLPAGVRRGFYSLPKEDGVIMTKYFEKEQNTE